VSLDDNFPLYFVFIDASKAFDVVCHAFILRRIHEAGIQDQDLTIIDEWYKDLTSRETKYNGKLSSKVSAMASVSNRPALVGGTPLVKPLCSLIYFESSLSIILACTSFSKRMCSV
jgi:hypothetical protein